MRGHARHLLTQPLDTRPQGFETLGLLPTAGRSRPVQPGSSTPGTASAPAEFPFRTRLGEPLATTGGDRYRLGTVTHRIS